MGANSQPCMRVRRGYMWNPQLMGRRATTGPPLIGLPGWQYPPRAGSSMATAHEPYYGRHADGPRNAGKGALDAPGMANL